MYIVYDVMIEISMKKESRKIQGSRYERTVKKRRINTY